jgi:hypothetical protein
MRFFLLQNEKSEKSLDDRMVSGYILEYAHNLGQEVGSVT